MHHDWWSSNIKSRSAIVPTFIEYGCSWLIGLCCLFIAFKQYRQNAGEWKIRFLMALGSLSLITSPWIGSLHKVVIGAYPTIDKGSLLFFEHGVHHLWLTNPNMPSKKLATFIRCAHRSPMGHRSDFTHRPNIHRLQPTNVPSFTPECSIRYCIGFDAYEWLKVTRMGKVDCSNLTWCSVTCFRDIHWYTVEKSALFPSIFVLGDSHPFT